MSFKRAKRLQSKLRMALVGPSGSGKTYSALGMAMELGNKIALIDTEHSSASLYADEFKKPFDVMQIDYYSPKEYLKGINIAAEAGYDVLIIDSLSHAWSGVGGILDQVDKAAKRTHNKFAGWRDATPEHNSLIDGILGAPMHIICTLRSKVEHVIEKDERGRTTIKKVGLQMIQRDGVDYEMTIVGDMVQDTHEMIISKTRWAKLADKIIKHPGGELGKQIREWLESADSNDEEISEKAKFILDTIKKENDKTKLESFGKRIDELVKRKELSSIQFIKLRDVLKQKLETSN